MDYRLLVIGTQECKIQDVVRAMKPAVPENFASLHQDWTDLARELLENSTQIINVFRQKNLLGVYTLEDIVSDILTEYVTQKGKGATLDRLLQFLEQKKLTTYKEALERKFGETLR